MPFANYTSTNNAQGTLLAGISAATTTAILNIGEGALFPSTFPFLVKCEKYDTALNDFRVLKREIWKVTGRTGDTLTIVRSFGTCPPDYTTLTPGTTAFSFDVGDTVSHIWTAEQTQDNQDEIARLETDKLDLAGGIMTGLVQGEQGADIASATTTDLATATGNRLKVTGTTTITSFGTVTAGTEITITFTDALTLTHNATSLILPTSANITTEAGDSGIFISIGSGNWKCTVYQKINGQALSAALDINALTEETTLAATDMAVFYDASTGSNKKHKIQASATNEGMVEMCTDAEALAGTDQTRYVNAKQAKIKTDMITATRDISLTGAVAYAHGLGVAPKYIDIKFTVNNSISDGVYNSVTSEQGVMAFDRGFNLPSGSGAVLRGGFSSAGNYTTGVITAISTTEITITYTNTGTPSGTGTLIMSAFA